MTIAEEVEQHILNSCLRSGCKQLQHLFTEASATKSEGLVRCAVDCQHITGFEKISEIYVRPIGSLSHLVERRGEFIIVQWPDGRLFVNIDYGFTPTQTGLGSSGLVGVSVLDRVCDWTISELLSSVLVKQINERQTYKPRKA